MRRHAGHRQHRRWNRDHWRVQCCKRRGRRPHQRVGGHRVLRQHTMGGGRGSGRGGSLVRRVKWRQGDTGHKDRWRGPRFGNVHKALTSDKLLDTAMPPTATRGIQARISCPVVHASTDRTDPVSWRRGPYKRHRRGGNMGLGFRVGTNVFLLGWGGGNTRRRGSIRHGEWRRCRFRHRGGMWTHKASAGDKGAARLLPPAGAKVCMTTISKIIVHVVTEVAHPVSSTGNATLGRVSLPD